MIYITYDISDTKLRTKFSKMLEKFGYRMQYSVFIIKNSDRLQRNILRIIDSKFKARFKKTDSVYLFKICDKCERRVIRYGFAKLEESEIIEL